MKKSVKQEYRRIIEDYGENQYGDAYWCSASGGDKFSDDLIREFQDKICWPCLSYYQILSENIMREFQDKLDWERISWKQNLSYEFISEYRDKLNIGALIKRGKITKNQAVRMREPIGKWKLLDI
jgi:hypothetical protein